MRPSSAPAFSSLAPRRRGFRRPAAAGDGDLYAKGEVDNSPRKAVPDGGIKPGMSAEEIRAAGLAIDLPYESGSAKPERLRYDVLEGKGWKPAEGFTIAGMSVEEINKRADAEKG